MICWMQRLPLTRSLPSTDAVEYLTHSLLYHRLTVNASYYGMSGGDGCGCVRVFVGGGGEWDE